MGIDIAVDRQATGPRRRTTDDALASYDKKTGPHGGPPRSPHHPWEVGMTRTDVMASSRPQAQGAPRLSRRTFSSLRRLIALPVVLLLAVAVVAPTSAVAASTTTSKEGLS